METAQEQFWKGDFGNLYITRNRIDYRARIPFWREVLDLTEAKSALEVGANIGTNLKALQAAEPHILVQGVEINEAAIRVAIADGLDVFPAAASEVGELWPQNYDLVFTAGVLIHIAPDHLDEAMDSIIAASKRYVLAVEYASIGEKEIDYRGHAERLWKRPFGKLYEAKGLRLVGEWDAGEGFDRCTAWLMEKA